MTKHLIFFSIVFLNLNFVLFFQKREVVEEVKIVIEPGMQLNQISDTLFKKSLIKNKLVFNLWVRINNSEKKLKFGEYSFTKEVSVNLILKKLKNGKTLSRKITIVEGTTKTDLLNALNNLDSNTTLSYEDIPDYIVANTYFYKFTDNPKVILKNIAKESSYLSRKIWNDRDLSIPLKNINELFILASIVEKETFLNEEKPIISGVFYNRLEKKMKLQSDPTVVYAITLGKKKMDRKLLRKDLKFKSKFNTYLHKDLPPSPICIPGIESLVGTAKPLKSNYLYFVSKNMKNEGHLFSENYKDHLENIKLIKERNTINE